MAVRRMRDDSRQPRVFGLITEANENMEQALRKFIVDNYLFGRDLDFSDDDSFLEKGIIDSTGVLELVTHLEMNYAIEVKDDELLPENLDSINRVVRFLNGKLQTAAPAAIGIAV
jgi:acyl carrier protein